SSHFCSKARQKTACAVFSNLDIRKNAAPARIWVLRQDKKLLAQFFYNLDIHPNAAPARIWVHS
ncbi:hypothetical protein, partial [uncultured Treponema sp.]|uniref:hypothetical protein n=1 Tax=uncultured Treponema sp. TaxID=162155 RepID=UPI002594B707